MPQGTVISHADGSPGADVAAVSIRIPADKDYVVLVRSAAGHLGARLGLTMTEIADLRLAVDEACSLLLAPAPLGGPAVTGGDIDCRFGVAPDGLRITVRARTPQATGPDTSSFGWSILSALVDRLTWDYDGKTAEVGLVKRRALRGA